MATRYNLATPILFEGAPQKIYYNLHKYILQLRQIYFAIGANRFCNWDKFILQFAGAMATRYNLDTPILFEGAPQQNMENEIYPIFQCLKSNQISKLIGH